MSIGKPQKFRFLIPNGLASCDCQLSQYHPVCINDLTYYSPCYAGCDSMNISEISTCTCISHNSIDFQNPEILSGSCESKRKCRFQVFLGLYFFTLMSTFIAGVPATNSILRIVPPELRLRM